MEKVKKKRNSILKKRTSEAGTSPTVTVTSTVKATRRISFSSQKSVKEFITGHENATVWLSSYEESANERSPEIKTTKIPISKQYQNPQRSCSTYNNLSATNNGNGVGMKLRSSKVLFNETQQTSRSKIAKSRQKKITLPSVHDKENVWIADEIHEQQQQEVEMDISMEHVDRMKEENKGILEEKNRNTNEPLAICIPEDLEISPIPVLSSTLMNFTNESRDEDLKFSDVSISRIAQLSDISIRTNEFLGLRKQQFNTSPELYTSFSLNVTDLEKIKAWRKGFFPINVNNSTFSNFTNSQQIDQACDSTIKLSFHSMHDTRIPVNDTAIENTMKLPKIDEGRTIVFSQGDDIDESVMEKRQHSELKAHSQIEDREEQMQLTKRCVLHLDDNLLQEISLMEIEKKDNKIVYSIRNQNKRMTFLPNDKMNLDQFYSNSEDVNVPNQQEKRRTMILGHSLEQIIAEPNEFASDYNQKQQQAIERDKNKRQTILYPNNGELEEESPTEANKDENKFQITSKFMCDDAELEVQAFTTAENYKKQPVTRNTIYFFEENILDQTNDEKFHQTSVNHHTLLEENKIVNNFANVSSQTAQSANKRTLNLCENIKVEKEEFQKEVFSESKLPPKTEEINGNVLQRQTICDVENIDLDLSLTGEIESVNCSVNDHKTSTKPAEIPNKRRTVHLNEDIELEQSLNEKYSLGAQADCRRTIHFNNDTEMENVSFDENCSSNSDEFHKNVTSVVQKGIIEPETSEIIRIAPSACRRTINLNEDIEIEPATNNGDDKDLNYCANAITQNVNSQIERSGKRPSLHLQEVHVPGKISKNTVDISMKRQTNYEFTDMEINESLMNQKEIENLSTASHCFEKKLDDSLRNSSRNTLKQKIRQTDNFVKEIDLEESFDGPRVNETLKFTPLRVEEECFVPKNESERKFIRKTLFPNDDCNLEYDEHLQRTTNVQYSVRENTENSIKSDVIIPKILRRSNTLKINGEDCEEQRKFNDTCSDSAAGQTDVKIIERVLTTEIKIDLEETLIDAGPHNMNELKKQKDVDRRTVIFPKQSELDLTCQTMHDLTLGRREIVHPVSSKSANSQSSKFYESLNDEMKDCSESCAQDEESMIETKNLNPSLRAQQILVHDATVPTSVSANSDKMASSIELSGNCGYTPILNDPQQQNQINLLSFVAPSSHKRNRTTLLQSPVFNSEAMIVESPVSFQPCKKERSSEVNSTAKKKSRQSRLPVSLARNKIESNKKSPVVPVVTSNSKSRRTIVFSPDNGGMDVTLFQPVTMNQNTCKEIEKMDQTNSTLMQTDSISRKPRMTVHFFGNNDLEISSQNPKTSPQFIGGQDSLRIGQAHLNSFNENSAAKSSPCANNGQLSSLPNNAWENISIQNCRRVEDVRVLSNSWRQRLDTTNLINVSGLSPIVNDDDNSLKVNNDDGTISGQNYKIENVFKRQSTQIRDSLCHYKINNTTHLQTENRSPSLEPAGNSTECLCNLDMSELNRNVSVEKEESAREMMENTNGTIFDYVLDDENSDNAIEKTHISLVDSTQSEESSLQPEIEIMNLETDTTNGSVQNGKSIAKVEPFNRHSTVNRSLLLLCKNCRKCRRTLDSNDTTLTGFAIEKVPQRLELDFSGYDKFEGMPTLTEVFEEHRKRMKLLDELPVKLKLEQTVSDPDVSSAEFLRENRCKESKTNKIYNFSLKSLFPLTPSFEFLLNNKFKSELSNWRLDDIHFIVGVFEVYHKFIQTHRLVFKFDPEFVTQRNRAIIFDDVQFVKNNSYYNPSPKSILRANELLRKIPYFLKNHCESSDMFFTFFNYFNDLCENVIQTTREFMKILIRCDATMEQNQNNELFVIKKTDPFTAEEKFFMIRIRYIDKISHTDILTPGPSEFNESIKLLPRGLDFVREFLTQPRKFLK